MTSTEVENYIVQVNASPEMSTFFRRYGINYRWYAMLCSAWTVGRIGLRGTLLLGMGMFLLGSVIGGLATNLETMIVSRILQGIPAGLLMPLAMTVIFQVFPHGKQGVAMGISSIGIILAPAIGPAVGGMAVDALSWRYVFFLGIPISVVSLLLVALSNGEKEGWSSNIILSYFTVFIVFGTGFIQWQRKHQHPLLDIELFGQRNFSIMCIVAFVFGAGLYASTYLIPLFLQLAQRMSPTEPGFLLERRTNMHRETFIDTQTYANGDTMELLQGLSAMTHEMGFAGTDSWNVARALLMKMIDSQALVAGFKDSFLLLTLVFLAALIPTWLLRRNN